MCIWFASIFGMYEWLNGNVMEIFTGIGVNLGRDHCIFVYVLHDERACAFANGSVHKGLASASERYKMVATDHFLFPDGDARISANIGS